MALPMSRSEYRAYIRSKDFDVRIRQPALARARGRCEACGKVKPLGVHHNDYYCVRTARELEYVRAICGRCHMRSHGRATRREQVATRLDRSVSYD